jgi:hypothetical protein
MYELANFTGGRRQCSVSVQIGIQTGIWGTMVTKNIQKNERNNLFHRFYGSTPYSLPQIHDG